MDERWATFDCYGTLIDWETGIRRTFSELWPEADPDQLLGHHHRLEPQVQAGSSDPYRAVMGHVLRLVADTAGLPLDPDDEGALAESLPDWPPFEEVPEVLAELRRRGWRIAILSNTDPDLLAASIERLGVEVDEQVTAAEAGSYKPAPGHWECFFAETGASRDRHIHVGASLFHDVVPANGLGLRTVWINRKNQTTDVEPDAELPDLSGLPGVLDGLVGPRPAAG